MVRFKIGRLAIVLQMKRSYGPYLGLHKFSFGKYLDIGPISIGWLN